MLIVRLDGSRFTWGGADLRTVGNSRDSYIAALKVADNHDLEQLIKFARS